MSSYPSRGSSSHLPRRHCPSKATAPVASTARASNSHSYGGTSHDQPTTSPASAVSNTIVPAAGPCTSMATRPRRTTKNWLAGCPSRNRNSPAAKVTFVAQPATSVSAFASSPEKKGCSGRYCSMVRMSALSGANSPDLSGDVDGGGAPRDAATAADASRRAELVHPRSELVGGPLAVSRRHRRTDAAAVQIGEVIGEAGVPHPPSLGFRPGQVAGVLDGRTEAGGTHECAVRAGEAAARRVFPPWVLGVGVEQVAKPFGVQRAPHAMGRRFADLPSCLAVRPGGVENLIPDCAGRQLVEDLFAAFAAWLDEEAVPVLVEELGQREVKVLVRHWSGAHRDAETGATGIGAGHRDDEVVLAPGKVRRVGHRPPRQDGVVDRERVKVAGPDAEQSQARGVDISWLDVHVGPGAPSAPEQLAGGEQQGLPRLRADDIAEHCLIAALTEPVAAAVLDISHPSWKLVDRLDLGMDDHTFPHCRPNDGPSLLAEQVDEQLQPGKQQDHSSDVVHECLRYDLLADDAMT